VPVDERVNLIFLPGAAQRERILAVERRRVLVHGVHVAAEHRLLVGEIDVHLGERLVLGVVVRDAVLNATALIGREGQVSEHRDCDGIQLRRSDLVVDERTRQRHLSSAVAGWRGECAEIPGSHRRRRHEADGGRRIASFDPALITAEEEHMITTDRTASCSAELVAAQAVARRCEEVARVEFVVAEELKPVAVKHVGAGLRDQIHSGRGMVSVARGQRTRFNLELL
jgi:hypothetical protein